MCHKTKTIKGAGRLRSVIHLAVEPVAPQILARFVYDDSVQTYQGQKIRDGHERIHAVGNVPHNSEIGDAADENGNDVEHAVSVSPALTLEIFHRTLTIIAPTENGAESECEQSEAQYERTDDGNLRESHLRKLRTIAIVDVRIGNDAAYDYESGERTYHHRVPESACGGNQSLAYRIPGAGSASGR